MKKIHFYIIASLLLGIELYIRTNLDIELQIQQDCKETISEKNFCNFTNDIFSRHNIRSEYDEYKQLIEELQDTSISKKPLSSICLNKHHTQATILYYLKEHSHKQPSLTQDIRPQETCAREYIDTQKLFAVTECFRVENKKLIKPSIKNITDAYNDCVDKSNQKIGALDTKKIIQKLLLEPDLQSWNYIFAQEYLDSTQSLT